MISFAFIACPSQPRSHQFSFLVPPTTIKLRNVLIFHVTFPCWKLQVLSHHSLLSPLLPPPPPLPLSLLHLLPLGLARWFLGRIGMNLEGQVG